MPIASKELDSRMRLMLFGDAKTMKTTWALEAAKAGFNVTLMDGDDGHQIVARFTKEERDKIGIIDMVDDFTKPHFYRSMVRLSRGKKFAINETTKDGVVATLANQWKETDPHVLIDPTALTTDDVLILDSWTALMSSMTMHYNIENKIDTIDADKQEWDDYSWAKRFISALLSKLHALPCHVIVICHVQVYEKYEGKGRNRELVSTNVQPMSYSGPQGKLLAKEFTDLLFFHVAKDKSFRISTKKEFGREGGSRVLPPKDYMKKDLTWQHLISESNGVYKLPVNPSPQFNSKGVQFFAAGELPEGMVRNNTAPKSITGGATLDAKSTTKVANPLTKLTTK